MQGTGIAFTVHELSSCFLEKLVFLDLCFAPGPRSDLLERRVWLLMSGSSNSEAVPQEEMSQKPQKLWVTAAQAGQCHYQPGHSPVVPKQGHTVAGLWQLLCTVREQENMSDAGFIRRFIWEQQERVLSVAHA